MKLTAQEEYGLRCLLQVARRAPGPTAPPVSIRSVAESEGLSVEYTAKLLRILRRQGLVHAQRGASGGFKLTRPAEQITLADALGALDTPLFDDAFCGGHPGQLGICVHSTGCAIKSLWKLLDSAVQGVLGRVTLADLVRSSIQPVPATVGDAP